MSKEENTNPQETTSEIKVEDLPVDESSEDDVKGGMRCSNNLKQLGIA